MPRWKMINSECHATDKITPISFNFSKRQNISQAADVSERLWTKRQTVRDHLTDLRNARVTRQQPGEWRIGEMIDLLECK